MADCVAVAEVDDFGEEVVAACEVVVVCFVLEYVVDRWVLGQEDRIEALGSVKHEDGRAWRRLVSELRDLHLHGFSVHLCLYFAGFDQRAHLAARDAELEELGLVEAARNVLGDEHVGRGIFAQPDEADLDQLVGVDGEAVVQAVLGREVLVAGLVAESLRSPQQSLLVQQAVSAAFLPVHENLHRVFPLDQLAQVLCVADRSDFLLEAIFDGGDGVEVELDAHHVADVSEELANASRPVDDRAGGGLLLEEREKESDDAHEVVGRESAEEELHVFGELEAVLFEEPLGGLGHVEEVLLVLDLDVDAGDALASVVADDFVEDLHADYLLMIA